MAHSERQPGAAAHSCELYPAQMHCHRLLTPQPHLGSISSIHQQIRTLLQKERALRLAGHRLLRMVHPSLSRRQRPWHSTQVWAPGGTGRPDGLAVGHMQLPLVS